MRSLGIGAVLAGLIALASGCAVAWRSPVVPPAGNAFNQTSAPVDLTYRATDFGSKRGKASAVCVLLLFGFGDASVAQAARNGNIQTVKHIDGEFLNVLGLYTAYTTVVYGD